jgi:hypothetical protein
MTFILFDREHIPTSYRLPALYGNANVGKNVLLTNRSPEKTPLGKASSLFNNGWKTFPETMPCMSKTSLVNSARF